MSAAVLNIYIYIYHVTKNPEDFPADSFHNCSTVYTEGAAKCVHICTVYPQIESFTLFKFVLACLFVCLFLVL